ncbi:hypothetical protein B0T24DRAFT_388054 [Lasiosphaeria ovina]|uniref:RRM domain-containing protein n=1 Tax=Lasiosphaeria ovina TaxID=92902 RepID=A0AAE0JZN0_9PEZI|nr:hypothetical protein B0T24DRAFT_388054 [Lasiosphaeria ovina]
MAPSRSRSHEALPHAADRLRSRTSRSPTPHSNYSRSPSSHGGRIANDRDPRARSPRRNGRYRSTSRSPSRSRSLSRSPSRGRSFSPGKNRSRGRDSRTRSRSRSNTPSVPALKSTKVVVERLTKNVKEDHLREIFGQYGEIEDLDLPMSRFGTNRGTAYILFVHEAGAEAAIANMHEAQLDGAAINVSIVLPRRKLSPPPPTARRGANFDPRNPPPNSRSGPAGGAPFGNPAGSGGRGRRFSPPAGGSTRFGPRSDTYRPRSMSRSRSRSPPPAPATANRRYRSRSRSYSSRSRSRTPAGRGGRNRGGGRQDDRERRRNVSRGSYDSYDNRSRSRSRDWDRR